MTILNTYENLLKGKLKRFPKGTWSSLPEENKALFKRLIRFAILDYYKWDKEVFCLKFCLKVIITLKLNTGFCKTYNRNIFPMIEECFPEFHIQPWDLTIVHAPKHYWTREKAILATKWLIDKELKWDLEKVNNEITNLHFIQHNLGGLLKCLDVGAKMLVKETYPTYHWNRKE
ncbi:DUF4046 domain-containing protein [Bacillus sp. Au-Bac7]|uniref:DUF4046 domain-containing protein n=1 Tax=Bacillus sp. Au-Bac7 TaxID=2906458 RepID=UPI001E37D104|nr:DUF4046 domain-containing protein [Bacillus sp. Au-Bac7]MCE4051662.1 DUF4046 domain-containing protein [Bacillus sp. Au-Bac7]